jgi:type IV pilus assembly protein PilM
MAVPQPGVWGIDIGQCALKALRLQNIDGVVTATAFDYIEHPKILSQPDADPDQLTREALEKFLSRNSIKGDSIAMSVPGQSGLARFVKLPPVEEKKISDIVQFEAKQQIPFNLDEVVWDYQKIGSGVVTDGFAMETEIGLFAIKRETVQRAMQIFTELEIDVHLIQMAPLALCNFVSYDLLHKDSGTEDEEESGGKKECVVALDIGVENSNMVITDGGRVIWQRPIPIGGNRFTRALTRELKLTFAKAEHLKKNATKSPDLKKILLALKPDLNEFVNEVQKSLQFFTNSHRDAHVQYMIGLGSAFRLPGLQKFLNEKLQLDVKRHQKFERLEGDSVVTSPVFSDNVQSFAIAYGLAVQGLKVARLQTNLLPPEIQLDRTIKAKKPWACAAAAALLLGVAGMTFGYRLENDSVFSPEIQDAMKTGDVALKHIDDEKKKCDDLEKEVTRLRREVRAVIAGQDERRNWLRLSRYINECLPRPDGKGPDGKELTDPQQKEYWEKMGGQRAYERYKTRQSGSKAEGNDEQGLDSLMQINVMNINALYTDKLEDYFAKLKETKKDLNGMPLDERDKPPTGGGWVVEIRGYTYHKEEQKFILDTLVSNLASRHKTLKSEEKKEDKAAKVDKKEDGEDEEGQPIVIEPIVGKISHVVLYRQQEVASPDPGVFPLIKDGFVAALLGIARTKEGEPPPGAAGNPRFNWKPLGGDAANILRAGDINAVQKAGKDEKKEMRRTEFVILFVWHEPTPSDEVKSSALAGGGTGDSTQQNQNQGGNPRIRRGGGKR